MSSDPQKTTPRGDRKVTVCSACLRAVCWHGEMMCDDAGAAGTVEKTVRELNALKREHQSYYSKANVMRVCGYA